MGVGGSPSAAGYLGTPTPRVQWVQGGQCRCRVYHCLGPGREMHRPTQCAKNPLPRGSAGSDSVPGGHLAISADIFWSPKLGVREATTSNGQRPGIPGPFSGLVQSGTVVNYLGS